MKRLIPLLATLAATSLAAQAALADERPTVATSQEAAKVEQQAKEAAFNGDWNSVVALSASAYADTPTLENEFNLATGYEQTGRSALAIPLYQDVAANADFTVGRAVYNFRSTERRPAHLKYYLADEANRRLARLTGE